MDQASKAIRLANLVGAPSAKGYPWFAVWAILAISVICTYTTVRLWTGKQPFPWTRPEWVTRRWAAAIPMTMTAWCLSLGGVAVGLSSWPHTPGWLKPISGVLLALALVIGCPAFVLMFSIVFVGRPRRLVPPRFR